MTLREHLKQMIEAALHNESLHKATLHSFLGRLVDEIEGTEEEIAAQKAAEEAAAAKEAELSDASAAAEEAPSAPDVAPVSLPRPQTISEMVAAPETESAPASEEPHHGEETIGHTDAEQAGADAGQPESDDHTADAAGEAAGAGGEAGADTDAGADAEPAPEAAQA